MSNLNLSLEHSWNSIFERAPTNIIKEFAFGVQKDRSSMSWMSLNGKVATNSKPSFLFIIWPIIWPEGSRLMRISLLRISLLRFFKKVHKFALCEFMTYALGYFISLVRFFGYFCPIWLMRILANLNFFQNQKSH